MTSLTHRAAFYRAFAQLLSAGASVGTAADSATAHLGGREVPPALAALHGALARGAAVSAALTSTGLFPSSDVRLVQLAERSGQLDALLLELADFYDELNALRRTVLSGLALPSCYLVVTAFVAPLPRFLTGGSALGYVGSSVGFLAVVALGVAGVLAVVRRARGAWLDTVLGPLPLLGRTWREFEYWRLTRNLAMLSRTSLGVIASVRLCAETCRSPRLASALLVAADEAEARGAPLSPSLRASGEFPAEMIALWQTGEHTGRLDEIFRRLAALFAERCQHRLRELARWLPRVVYLIVALYMTSQIFRLAGSYIGALNG